ncbi:MAG: SLATT domain-containing protein [Chloroflexi bacterium]|nr:SLATT domain-containing protein [Chloroflexota bacterium]
METQPQQVTPILEVAWGHFAQLDAASSKRTKSHMRMRRWITVLGVLATLLAIITELYAEFFLPVVSLVLKILLIATPIVASILAAFVGKFFSSGDWLITRAGAEEILKEIYAYRTILQRTASRRAWLEKRLEEIQRSVFRGMNGELILEPYKGELPPAPRFSPEYPDSDPGFNDLTGEEYFRYRLDDQLKWHTKEVNKRQKERVRLQWFILIAGGMGALLAAFGSPISLWVALTAALTSALIGWQELRNLDTVVRNYSKVIMELTILSDHWKNLEAEEKNQTEFYQVVRSTENILWSQNVEYIKAMQEALRESDLEEKASLINNVIQEQRKMDERFQKSMRDSIVDYTKESMEKTEEALEENFKEVLGSLAEEASSEVVQAELAAMKEAAQEMVENIVERIGGLSSSLKAIKEEFDGVEIGGNTPPSVLNDLLSRYPKTSDVKG